MLVVSSDTWPSQESRWNMWRKPSASALHRHLPAGRPHNYQNAKQEAFWGPVEGRLIAMLEHLPDLTLSFLDEATQAWVEYEGASPISEWTLRLYLVGLAETAGGGEGGEALIEGGGADAAARAQLDERQRAVDIGECGQLSVITLFHGLVRRFFDGLSGGWADHAPTRSSMPSCSRPSRTLRAADAVARSRAILDRRCARRHGLRAGRDGRMAPIEQKDGTQEAIERMSSSC